MIGRRDVVAADCGFIIFGRRMHLGIVVDEALLQGHMMRSRIVGRESSKMHVIEYDLKYNCKAACSSNSSGLFRKGAMCRLARSAEMELMR